MGERFIGKERGRIKLIIYCRYKGQSAREKSVGKKISHRPAQACELVTRSRLL